MSLVGDIIICILFLVLARFAIVNDINLFLMIFPRMSLHCKLVPVQCREYEDDLSCISFYYYTTSPRYIFKSNCFLLYLICLVSALSAPSRNSNAALTKQNTKIKCFGYVDDIKRCLHINPAFYYNRTCFPEVPSSPSRPGSPLSPFLKTQYYTLLFIQIFDIIIKHFIL